MPLVARCGSSFLRTVTFLIIHRFLPLKFPLLYICFSKSTAYNIFQFKKMCWIWWKVLDTITLWQDVGPCCEQTHAAFEVGLSLDHGQGVYSGWSDVVVSSQLRLCHTCIIDVMVFRLISRSWFHNFQTLTIVAIYRRLWNDAQSSVEYSEGALFFFKGIYPISNSYGPKWHGGCAVLFFKVNFEVTGQKKVTRSVSVIKSLRFVL